MRARLQVLLAAVVVCSGCTIEKKGAQTEAEFHPPFTYPQWESRVLTDGQGRTACIVTAGENGYSFVVRKTPQGNVVSVQGERFMPAGTWNTVTVNGHRYETSERYFSARDAVAMAQDFSVADKAYAEWSELRGYNGRVRYSAIYKLAGFKQKFDECSR